MVQKLKLSKISVTKKLPVKGYMYLNEKKIRKIRIIFDIEIWLWKSDLCYFWQLLLVVDFGPKGRPGGKICDSAPYTGKSLSEALIFALTNPQYDSRLFIESPVQ